VGYKLSSWSEWFVDVLTSNYCRSIRPTYWLEQSAVRWQRNQTADSLNSWLTIPAGDKFNYRFLLIYQAMGWTTVVRFPAGTEKHYFLSPKRPEWLWGQTSLLSNGGRVLFPRGQSGQGVKLTTHFHLVPRLGMSLAIPPLPNTSSCRGD